MQDLCMHDSVEAFLKRDLASGRVFDSLGIDYCCGGARTLEAACRAAGVDPERAMGLLGGSGTAVPEDVPVPAPGIADLAQKTFR